MRFIIFVTAILFAAPSQAQFALDLSHDQYQKQQGIITLTSQRQWACTVPAARRLVVVEVNGYLSLSELLEAYGG